MDIVIRAAVTFLLLWLITRSVGRSTLGELSSFELLLFIVMGDLIQQGVTQEDHSVTGAILAVGTMGLLTVILQWSKIRWPRLRRFIHGSPIVIVRDGEPDLKAMFGERMGIDDLMSAARGQGFQKMSEISLAVLEPNGKVSIFSMKDAPDASKKVPDKPSSG